MSLHESHHSESPPKLEKEKREEKSRGEKPREKDREKSDESCQEKEPQLDETRRRAQESAGQREPFQRDSQERQKRIESYQQQCIPRRLRKSKKVPLSRLMTLSGSVRQFEKEHAGEQIFPERGPFLVIANHSGGETWKLLALLRRFDTHIAAAQELNFGRSPLRRALLNKLRMLPVVESLANLHEKEKQELLERIPGTKRKESYRAVMEREASLGAAFANAQFLQESVALLSRGDVLVMFPEGPFLYDGKTSLRKGYGGVETIAHAFQRLTGETLKIVPVGISKAEKGRVRVGRAFTFTEKPADEEKPTDWMMRQLAVQLPEQERGFYTDSLRPA